jgi:hypothetical protein
MVGAASVAQAEPGLQSKLTAISGQGTGHVEVSLPPKAKAPSSSPRALCTMRCRTRPSSSSAPSTSRPNGGVCTIAPGPPAGWIILTTLTTSTGGADAAHFELVAPPPGPSGFPFDIVLRVMSTDGTQVLMSDCMTVTVK